jgi:hypothetical protein
MSVAMLIGFVVVGLLFCLGSVLVLANQVIGIKAKIIGMENSTHSIQYVPVDNAGAFEELSKEDKERLKDEFGVNLFPENIN